MNSKSVIKRTLPLVIVLLVIIGIAISCTVFNREEVVPAITDANGEYLTITEGDRTYSISKQKMYEQLKKTFGQTTLLDEIDKNLLRALPKDSTNYWDAITDAEIDQAIEDAIFPDGKDDLTVDEIQEKTDDYYDNLFATKGLRTDVLVRDYHRLTLAKKLYARDQLEEAIAKADADAAADTTLDPYFTDDEITTYYDANYKNGYWTIIVPFDTQVEATNLLDQLGYSIHEKDANSTTDFSRWVKDVAGVETTLTPYEVVKAFIDMYNTVYSHQVEGYPNSTLSLIKDTQYTETVVGTDTKISFNTEISDVDEAKNMLYYTYDEMIDYQSEIENYIKRTMKTSYESSTDTVLTSSSTWYTPTIRSYNSGTLYCFILKIVEEVAPDQEDVIDEIKDALFEKELTDTYISTEMVKLRAENDILFYDPDLEAAYVKTASSFKQTHPTSKEESKTLVAKIGTTEYSADDLFDLIDKYYGITLAYAEINYERMLSNLDFNKIYDYYLQDSSDKERILDADKWESIIIEANNLKNNFVANAYASYGFSSTYGWSNFIRDVYGASDDKELLYSLLYQKVKADYSAKLGDVTEIVDTDALWTTYNTKMQNIINEFYSVSGIQLLISVTDEEGNRVDPVDWTVYQNTLAKQLYEQIWTYMREIPGESAAKFQEIATAFKEAPRFLATTPQDLGSQPAGFGYVYRGIIEVAKFKTAGLDVEYSDLGTYTNTDEADLAPVDAAKIIWNSVSDKPSTEHIPYLNEADNLGVWTYLVTEHGYHAYINTAVNAIATWDAENDTVLPTLQMVKTYLEDNASEYLLDENGDETDVAFTTAMKTAVTTFFTPIQSEITGSYYPNIKLFTEMKTLNITFKMGNYTSAEFNQYLDLQIASSYDNLNYFAFGE
ncbi:MAG: hypothetical protein AB7T03_00390 [Bacilli bacterium]